MIKRLCKPLAAFFIVVMAIAIASPLMLQMVQAADNADTTKVLSCEVDADVIVHKHDENCYDESGNLICPLAEVDAHTHTKDCYPAASSEETAEQSTEVTDETPSAEETDSSVSPAPTCGQEEIILHSHDNSCYDASGALTCGLPVVVAHQHTSDCFTTQEVVEEDTAGKAETKTNAQVVTEDGKDDDGDDDSDEINLEIDGDALAQDAMGTAATTGSVYSDFYVGYARNYDATITLDGRDTPAFYLTGFDDFISAETESSRIDGSEVAYCFNNTAHGPDSRSSGGFNKTSPNVNQSLIDTTKNYYNIYEKQENASNDEFERMATNENTARLTNGMDLKTKVLSIALNGYPHDYSGIQTTYDLEPDEFRALTQFAIWYYTDSIELTFTTQKYADAYAALIASDERAVLDQVSFINLYEDKGVTDGETLYKVGSSEFYKDGKGYQNLLNVGTLSEALPNQPRQVTVSKTVTGETNSTTLFDFTITMTKADGTSADGTYTATLYSATNTAGEAKEITVKNGTGAFQLADGQKMTINLGTDDVSYTITEIKTTGYAQTVEAVSGTTTEKTDTSLSVTREHAGGKDTVDFTNTKLSGSLTLKKVVNGAHDPNEEFTFMVFIAYTNGDGDIVGQEGGTLQTDRGDLVFDPENKFAYVTLKDGESIEIQGLPTEKNYYYGYIILEAVDKNEWSPVYVQTVAGGSAGEFKDQTTSGYATGCTNYQYHDSSWKDKGLVYNVLAKEVTVTCTNTITPEAEEEYLSNYKNLTLSKVVKDHGGTEITPSGSFRFDLILNDASGTGISDSYTAIVTNTETNSTSTKTVKFTNGKAAVYLKAGQSMTIEALPSGSTYIIKEEDTDQYTTTVETTGEKTGARDPDTGVSTSGTLDDNLTVKYTNQVSYGKLKITKTLLDKDDNENGDWLKEFTFDVTLVYKDSGAPYADQVVYLEQGGTTTEQRTDAVTGKLTVTASVSSPATLLFTDDVTYTVEEDLTNSTYNNYALYSSTNTRNTVTVGGTKTTAFTNKYYGTYSGVYVAKVWNDNNDTSDRKTVYVQIYKNGTEKIKDEFSPTASTNFRNSGAWTNGYTLTLNSYEKGEKVIYSVVEKSMAGYTTSYSDMEVDANGFVKLTVTNTKKAAVPTGINITWLPFAVVGVLAAGGLGVLIWYNHKKKVE